VEQDLAPTSSKLSFIVAKKAYSIAKRLKIEINDNKAKIMANAELDSLSKIVMKEIDDVESFYKVLTNYVISSERKLLADSAFEL
jgi:hypothetical protein